MDNKNISTIAEVFHMLANGLESGSFDQKPKVIITGQGSEHGEENVLAGAMAAAKNGIDVLYLGTLEAPADIGVKTIISKSATEDLEIMEDLLNRKEADAAVAMHYSFPIGVSTIGLVDTPARGRRMFIASTTGTSSSDRVEGMVLNAINGIATAKAYGLQSPTVGILNLDGARQVERILKQLSANGYTINFCRSVRADGGSVLRGNDVLLGTPDIMVTDPLTGNVLMKLLSAGNSGGVYETIGCGYGPGVGADYGRIINIISRASGAPLIARAIEYAARMVSGGLIAQVDAAYKAARKAGLDKLLSEYKSKFVETKAAVDFVRPEKEIVTAEISGIDVMEIENAVIEVMRSGIYAEGGMGCTGPIIRVSEQNLEAAYQILVKADFISAN